MSDNAVLILVGFATNLIAIVGFWMKLEQRLTRVETIVKILASRSGIHVRESDNVLKEE